MLKVSLDGKEMSGTNMVTDAQSVIKLSAQPGANVLLSEAVIGCPNQSEHQ